MHLIQLRLNFFSKRKRLTGFALLLATMCVLWQCSKKDSSHSKAGHFEAYFKVGNTPVGITIIAKNIDEPWDIEWGPGGWIWMTEFHGVVSKVNPKTGKRVVMLKLKDVYTGSNTPGLLGMAI